MPQFSRIILNFYRESDEIKIHGHFFNPNGFSLNDKTFFTRDLLLKFLNKEVYDITEYQCDEVGRKLQFSGVFKLRSANNEDYLFDLNNWPLGVQNIVIL